MRILTVAGAKGGVGKTSSALGLASELARGCRVGVRDLDPQSSATLALGQDPVSDPFAAAAVPTELEGIPVGNLVLFRGGRALARAGAGDVEHLLADREELDVLVVDCPPFLGALTIGALERADLVLVPLEPAPMAIPGLHDVADVLRELETPSVRLRAVLVRVQARRLVSGEVREMIEEAYPGALYAAEIPEDVRCTEAPAFGQPVTVFAPRSRASEAYRELAAEVMEDLKGGNDGREA